MSEQTGLTQCFIYAWDIFHLSIFEKERPLQIKIWRWLDEHCVTFENGLMRFLYHRWSQLLMAWCFLLVQWQQCWCDSELLPEPVGSRKKPSVSFVALEILHNSNKTAAIAACFLSQLSSGWSSLASLLKESCRDSHIPAHLNLIYMEEVFKMALFNFGLETHSSAFWGYHLI